MQSKKKIKKTIISIFRLAIGHFDGRALFGKNHIIVDVDSDE